MHEIECQLLQLLARRFRNLFPRISAYFAVKLSATIFYFKDCSRYFLGEAPVICLNALQKLLAFL